MFKLLKNLIKKPLGCLFSILFMLGMLLLLVGIVGVLVVDHYAVDVASRVLQQRSGFTMTVNAQDISALSGAADLKGLQIINPDRFPSKDFVTLNEFKIKVDPASLLTKRIIIDELVVDVDSATIVETKDGELNLLALKKSFAAAAPASSNTTAAASATGTLPPFTVKKFTLRIGTVKMLDYSAGNASTAAVNVKYERTFTDMTEADVTTVSAQIATDLSADGAAFASQVLLNKTLQGVTGAVKGAGDAAGAVGNAISNMFK